MSSPPVVVIAGTASGVGKTSVATGLMAALRAAGHTVQGTKVGPDFIDPSFHALATGRPARNLDAWLSGPDLLVPLLRHGSAGADVTVVEGVMGLFDGARPDDEFASTAHIAKALGAPVLLVVDAAAIARSAAAVVHGYATFDPALHVAGVILNRVGSVGHADMLRSALAPLGISVVGALPHTEALTTPSRHLGLVPVAERDAQARRTVKALGDWVAAHMDLGGVMALARGARVPAATPWSPRTDDQEAAGQAPVGIAVATGPAFSFRYTENLEVMAAAGAELLPFDPMTDSRLPHGTQALYLGGGFPQVHGEALAANAPMRAAVAAQAATGVPVVAECGGLLYLARELDGTRQTGVLPTSGRMTDGLTMGYRSAHAATDSALWRRGEVVHGHEFHRTVSQPVSGPAPAWIIDGAAEGFVTGGVHASYLHTHWAATPVVGARLVAAARVAAARDATEHDARSAVAPITTASAGPARRAPAAPVRGSYLPAGAVTGVGSLPIAEPSQAVAFVAAHAPEVPFWPQLPLRHAGEGMLRQTLGDPGPLIVAEGSRIRVARGRVAELIAWLDDAPAAIATNEAAGFQAFVRALRRGQLPAARAIKGQLTGPLTLGEFLHHDGRPASQDPELAAALVRRVATRAAWQARRLADHGLPTLVVVDEPVLGAAGPTLADDAADALLRVLQAIRDNGAMAGVHTCATDRIPLLADRGEAMARDQIRPLWQPDLWSVDLQGREGMLPQPVRDRWAEGGLLAAGLVPTAANPSALPSPADLVGAWLAAAAATGDVEALADRTLVTATCGLAGVDVDAAAASFAHAAETARHIRRLAGAVGAAGGALHRRGAPPPHRVTRMRKEWS